MCSSCNTHHKHRCNESCHRLLLVNFVTFCSIRHRIVAGLHFCSVDMADVDEYIVSHVMWLVYIICTVSMHERALCESALCERALCECALCECSVRCVNVRYVSVLCVDVVLFVFFFFLDLGACFLPVTLAVWLQLPKFTNMKCMFSDLFVQINILFHIYTFFIYPATCPWHFVLPT